MSTNLTTYGAKAILMHVFRADAHTALTQPAAVYLALFTADPTKAGTQTDEVSGGSYARKAITFGSVTTAGSGDTSTQHTENSEIDFDAASADWGEVTHVGVMDASTSGNMLAFGPLSSSKTVEDGDTFTVPAGDLTLDLG